MILLVHPPVTKPCEPPAGIARLAGLLSRRGVSHRLLDANLEGLLHLLGAPPPAGEVLDTWTKRAFRNRQANLAAIRDSRLYRNIDTYSRTVRDLTQVFSATSPAGTSISLANYTQESLSPLRSGDLLTAAEEPEKSPFHGYFASRLEELFRREEPSVVGVSLNYLSQALPAFSMIGQTRRLLPRVKVILGGGLVTTWLSNPLRDNPFAGLVDHLVAGPGEFRILSLLGIGGEVSELPPPDYRPLPLGFYLSPGSVLPYSASSGCCWRRCSFCPEAAEGSRYLQLPAERALADLSQLAAEHRPALFHLLDNAVSPGLLDALSRHPLAVPWYGFARIGGRLTDLEFCRALKRSGCAMLKLGIESGDQQVLDALDKGIAVETASRVLRNLKSAGIATFVYLLFGTPPETEASARRTLDFAVRHSGCIDFLNLALFNMPLCGTASADLETRSFSEGDLSLYTDFLHPAGWDRKRVRTFLEREFRTQPALSAILRRVPPVFTSNHAPFFVAGLRPPS